MGLTELFRRFDNLLNTDIHIAIPGFGDLRIVTQLNGKRGVTMSPHTLIDGAICIYDYNSFSPDNPTAKPRADFQIHSLTPITLPDDETKFTVVEKYVAPDNHSVIRLRVIGEIDIEKQIFIPSPAEAESDKPE